MAEKKREITPLKTEQFSCIHYGDSGMNPGAFLEQFSGMQNVIWNDNGKRVEVYRVVS